MSRHAKPVRMQKNTTPQPQTSASGPKKPSSAPHCWAHSETASVSQNLFKKKNIYIYNIHIIQFFSTAAHFAFPKNLKASPVARKHVARPRWCDCSARILILWCPRFVIYSRTLTPNFPLRLLSAIIRMTRNFLKPSWKTTHVHNEVLCFFPHQNRSLFFEVRPRHESKYECKCSLANIVYAIQLRSVAVKQKFCMQRKVVTQNKVHSTNPCAWTQCTQ